MIARIRRIPLPQRRSVLGAVRFIVVVAAVIFVARTFLVQVYGITTPSMGNTLRPGDYVVTSNLAFGAEIPLAGRRTPTLREPRRGDVVVYRERGDTSGLRLIKRVIGLPGDTVQMVGRQVIRNGETLRETYVAPRSAADQPLRFEGPYAVAWHRDVLPAFVDRDQYQPTRDNWGPLVVPAGQYLLLGDDRDRSIDSRVTGFVAREQIQGQVLAVYYSLIPDPSRPFPRVLTAARWNRIGGIR